MLGVDFDPGGGPTAPSRKYSVRSASSGWWASCSGSASLTKSLSLGSRASPMRSLSWTFFHGSLRHYLDEVFVDALYYDPWLGAVVVVGFSMNMQFAGQVMHREFVPSIISS